MEGRVNIATVWGNPIGLHFSWRFVFGLVTWSLAGGYFPAAYRDGHRGRTGRPVMDRLERVVVIEGYEHVQGRWSIELRRGLSYGVFLQTSRRPGPSSYDGLGGLSAKLEKSERIVPNTRGTVSAVEWLNYHHLLYFWTVAREGSIARSRTRTFCATSTRPVIGGDAASRARVDPKFVIGSGIRNRGSGSDRGPSRANVATS